MSPVVFFLAVLFTITGQTFGQLFSYDICDNQSHYCFGQANCVEGRCQCLDGYHGRALLYCASNSASVCQIYNDPNGRTYADEPSEAMKFSLPCVTLMTNFTNQKTLTEGENVHRLECNVKILTAQTRAGNRKVVHGFEVLIEWVKTAISGSIQGDPTGQYSFRVNGQAINQSYYMFDKARNSLEGQYWSNLGFGGYTDHVGGDATWTTFDMQKYGILYMEHCGFSVVFRPPDLTYVRTQDYMPGVTILITNDPDSQVSYNEVSTSFCLHPNTTEYNVSRAKTESNLDTTSTFIYNSLTSGVHQDFPDVDATYCTSLQTTANGMTDPDRRKKAFDTCVPMLQDGPFANCIDDTRNFSYLLDLFDQCLNSVYDMDEDLCSSLTGAITAANCADIEGLDCLNLL